MTSLSLNQEQGSVNEEAARLASRDGERQGGCDEGLCGEGLCDEGLCGEGLCGEGVYDAGT